MLLHFEAPHHAVKKHCAMACIFVPLHLRALAPLHPCTTVLHQPITNHLYANTLLNCIFTGYSYTHWNYTNYSIKHIIIFKFFTLMESCLSVKSLQIFALWIPTSTDLSIILSSAAHLFYFWKGDIFPTELALLDCILLGLSLHIFSVVAMSSSWWPIATFAPLGATPSTQIFCIT